MRRRGGSEVRPNDAGPLSAGRRGARKRRGLSGRAFFALTPSLMADTIGRQGQTRFSGAESASGFAVPAARRQTGRLLSLRILNGTVTTGRDKIKGPSAPESGRERG